MSTTSEVRELPILFTGEMVRAILGGQKTQTRRVVTDRTSQGNFRASVMRLDEAWVDPGPSPAGNPGPYIKAPLDCAAVEDAYGWEPGSCAPEVVERLYPRVFPGDLLYVREAFRVARTYDPLPPRELPSFIGDDFEPFVGFESDEQPEPGLVRHWGKRRQSIFMPKAFARIWLRLTDVRVERVQEMTEEDARAEGCEESEHVDHSTDGKPFGDGLIMGPMTEWHSALGNFQILWDDLNDHRGYSWASNPWAWVLTFERTEAP